MEKILEFIGHLFGFIIGSIVVVVSVMGMFLIPFGIGILLGLSFTCSFGLGVLALLIGVCLVTTPEKSKDINNM